MRRTFALAATPAIATSAPSQTALVQDFLGTSQAADRESAAVICAHIAFMDQYTDPSIVKTKPECPEWVAEEDTLPLDGYMVNNRKLVAFDRTFDRAIKW